jgi:hypothetical protein
VVPEVAHTDFTATTKDHQDAQGSLDSRDPQLSQGSQGGQDFTSAGHADAAAECYDDAHPVFTSTPDAGDKPFDHEGLW